MFTSSKLLLGVANLYGVDAAHLCVHAPTFSRASELLQSIGADSVNGLRYRRIVGFDNAHPVPTQGGPAGKKRVVNDHRHRFKTIRPYDYKDAATLLEDFWAQVDSVLKEEGVIS